ncbi:hypothetical protein LWI28_020781 [Acer negundo]|uniref:Uncharacterized protein n=1 Tax=Acer negundo TaxID=4023 RepID=A0AAD5NWA7_ACENE|nr:hypothetical protein LWI28_020781 [Acer negundo]
MAPLLQPAKASEEGRQATMVEAQCYLCYLDNETVRSLRRHEEMECLKRKKREKRLMQDENLFLRETVQNLEAQVGPSFKDRNFTSCYEVATALPPPFDLHAALNWDHEQIMAKAAQLVGDDQAQEDPPQDDAYPEEDDPAGIGVLEVEATHDDLVAEREEDALAGSNIPTIEEAQTDTATEVTREGAAGQGLGDSKTRSKTKQPEPSTSTVRTLGVDWAAHDKPKLWWAAHGSLVWPYGLRKAAPLWGCGLRMPMGEGRRMSVWLMGHLKILYS